MATILFCVLKLSLHVPAVSVKSGGGANIGVIVGAAIGGIVILLIVFALSLYCFRGYVSRKHHDSEFRLSDFLGANDNGSSAHDHLKSRQYFPVAF